MYPPFLPPMLPYLTIPLRRKIFWAAEFNMEISLDLVLGKPEKALSCPQYVYFQQRMSNLELPFGFYLWL